MCLGPLTAYYAADRNISGKRGLVFDRKASFSGIPVKLPCGQCMECRLEYSRQWAMRCLHEKRMHSSSSFVTLTYDDKSLPIYGNSTTLVKRDLQLFMKRLRWKFGAGVRFYGCGEYGDTTDRPHYHVLLFNLDFADKKFHARGKRDGEVLYTSSVLRDLWPAGYNVIGDVTFDSCAYVARYVTKKITGGAAEDHYGGRQPEFVLMSRKPGIGTSYFMKYAHEIYAHDSVVMNGVEVRPPRFYDDKWKAVDSTGLDDIKKARKRRFLIARVRADETSRRRRDREVVSLAKRKLWRPSL